MTVLSEAHKRIALWREEPIRFVRDELRWNDLDDFQVEFFKALGSSREQDQRIAQKASKGPGKTFNLACAGWWFLATQGDRDDHPNGIATSITEDNLKDNLWKELAKQQNRSEFLKSAFTWTKTRIYANDHPATWWLAARNWPKSGSAQEQADSMAGLHSGYVLALVDESGGVPPAVMATLEAMLSSAVWGKICQAGNPTSLDSALYEACTKQRRLWNVITINGDPDNPKRAKRVSIAWARQQIELHGRENPWVLVNVFGEFPPASINTLLGIEDVERAFTRYGAIMEDEYNYAQKRIGCDMSRFGDDRQVFFPRQGLIALKPVVMRNQRGPALAARVALMRKRWRGNVQLLVDDTGGYGATLIDSLLTAGIPSIPIDFGGKAIDPRYENRRSEMWWNMAEWVKDRGAIPPGLTDIVPELTKVHYTFTAKGRLLLEPKDDVKDALGYSPDLADALALTFALPDMPDMNTEGGQALAEAQGAGGMDSDWDPMESDR